jgi:glutamate mutase epsilon subunit
VVPNVELGAFVRESRGRGELVVQPRMGMADPAQMAVGLRAVMEAPARTAGTITLDSYTRLGDYRGAREAFDGRRALNGYPIVFHDRGTTRRVVSEVGAVIPVQVRHGSARPRDIFRAMARCGLSATEGGPVSYCLPYGRTPLRDSVAHWRDAVAELAEDCETRGLRAHLETFGGCLLGQLCPPSLLLAVSVLEAMFFVQRGVDSVSLSYTQQTSALQDAEALLALRALAGEMLPQHVDWHVVLYTYMGVYPRTAPGARALLELSADLAVLGHADRLIVKTAAEASRIPTIAENVEALVVAAERAKATTRERGHERPRPAGYENALIEARTLIEAVLELSDDIGQALREAFAAGLLDVPFCLHQDNRGLTQAAIDGEGRLRWARLGRLPLTAIAEPLPHGPVRAGDLLGMLQFVAHQSDRGLATSDPVLSLHRA